MNLKWMRRRKRVFEIIEVGNDLDHISRLYDFINAFSIIINLTVSIMYTFAEVREQWGTPLVFIESVTVSFFAVDYALRIWTARFIYPDLKEIHAIRDYMCSSTGVVDLFSFLPYFLPVFFPTGTVAFRMIRIVRIFRLFRINSYYDSLSVIKEVIKGKRQQLISSVFIISVFMVAVSLCMYSVENEAQPEVFSNAFSGIWWAASTLLTVGYGDIYPVTTLGKALGILIAFLGVGMVAIPTGIISAGFVDQYATIKKRIEHGYEADLHFIKIRIKEQDSWAGKKIYELALPTGVIIAAIKRKEDVLIPRGNLVLQAGDQVILGAEPMEEGKTIKLKEIELQSQNPWTGAKIRDLDISRHSIIVLVKREGKAVIPYGDLTLHKGDIVFIYTQLHLADSNEIEI